MFPLFSLIFLIVCPLLASAQATQTVSVGVEGSFYSPETVSAQENDTIVFVFGGDIHSVTQADGSQPCVPLAGGIFSGFAGRGPTFSNATKFWSVKVTNASTPIWYFCSATAPTSHCAQGMVGAINPPSIAAYDAFKAAAQKVVGQPPPPTAPVLVGTGLSAASTPTTIASVVSDSSIPSSPTPTPSTSSDSSTAPPPSASPMVAASHVNVGAIAGGTAGGVIAFLAILSGILWCFCRRRSRARPEFYGYPINSPPPPMASLVPVSQTTFSNGGGHNDTQYPNRMQGASTLLAPMPGSPHMSASQHDELFDGTQRSVVLTPQSSFSAGETLTSHQRQNKFARNGSISAHSAVSSAPPQYLAN